MCNLETDKTREVTPRARTPESDERGKCRPAGERYRVDGMARGVGDPSAKRAKVDEAEEEEDPLVRRKEELVVAAKEGTRRIDQGGEAEVCATTVVSVCTL